MFAANKTLVFDSFGRTKWIEHQSDATAGNSRPSTMEHLDRSEANTKGVVQMSDHISLAQFYAGWEVYQTHLTKAIAPLTAEQLTLQISPQLRSIMTLSAHIISARVWWFHYVMREGPIDLEPMVEWDDDGAPARTATELVHGLNVTWDVIEAGLARWTPADLTQEFPRPGARPPRSYSRQWIIWHVLEHDLHHGGELSFLLGKHGLPAIDL